MADKKPRLVLTGFYFNIIDKEIGIFKVMEKNGERWQVFDKLNLPLHHLRFFSSRKDADKYKAEFIASGKATDVFMGLKGTYIGK